MAWKLERKKKADHGAVLQFWRPWEWELFFSSCGLSQGDAWTKRGAKRAMLIEQGRMWA